MKPQRHVQYRFWTFDDPNDPNAVPVPAALVPVPGDGVHDGEDDNFAYAAHPPLGAPWPGSLQKPRAD